MRRQGAPGILASANADPLYATLVEVLGRAGQGTHYACGQYLLELAAGASPEGILIACRTPLDETAARIESATGWTRAPGTDGALALSGSSGRGVVLVDLYGSDIDEHLRYAAFTVLALAADLGATPPSGLIDPYGGLEDLDRGCLRTVDIFDGPLTPERCLLAADLFRRFGLQPDERAMLALREASTRIDTVAPPHAWQALARIFSGSCLSGVTRFMRSTGALGALLPEVAAVYDLPQNYYHHLGVWDHTLETLDRLEETLLDPASFSKAYGNRLDTYLSRSFEGGVSRRAFLAFAGLIHDIGKAGTMTVEPSGRIRFQGHQEEGGRLAASIASRLGMGNAGAKHLAGIVRDHMKLGFLLKEGETTASRLRAVMEMDGHCAEVVLLSVADRAATRGEASTEEALERYRRVATRVLGDWVWIQEYPPLIDGRDVIVHAGMPQGPRVAEALFKARVAQREGTVSSRAEALEFLAPDFKGRMDTRG